MGFLGGAVTCQHVAAPALHCALLCVTLPGSLSWRQWPLFMPLSVNWLQFLWLPVCLAFCIILSHFLLLQLMVNPSSQIFQGRSGCVCVKFLHLSPKAALGLSCRQWKLLLVWEEGATPWNSPVPAGAEKGPCVADIGPF